MLCIFVTGGAYAPYATCMATPTPLVLRNIASKVKSSKIRRSKDVILCHI